MLKKIIHLFLFIVLFASFFVVFDYSKKSLLSFNYISDVSARQTVISNVYVPTVTNLQVDNKTPTIARISWNKVPGAFAYEIYMKNNKTGAYRWKKTIKNSSPSYFEHKYLSSNVEHVYAIKTVKRINGRLYRSNLSYWVSTYNNTRNVKFTNVKSMRFVNSVGTLSEKSRGKMNITIIPKEKNKMIYNRNLRWWTSDKNIATVDNNGWVRTYNPGRVTIYVKAHNGITASHKLNVLSWHGNKIPIITFHRIVSDESKQNSFRNDQWVASVSDFAKQMAYLYDNNYKTISAEEFEDWYDRKIEYPRRTAMITFDDGDYELYHLVLPILKKYNFKATAFLVGSRIGNQTASFQNNGRFFIGNDVINEVNMLYPNLKFENHSYNLHYETANKKQAVLTKTYNDIDQDFKNNSKYNFSYIAYPYGVFTNDFKKAAKANGMRMGFKFGTDTYATRSYDRYEIPRVKINGQITYDQYVKKMRSYIR